MRRKVRIRPLALADLAEQGAYLAGTSTRTALRFYRAAESTFAQLLAMPGIGPECTSDDPRLENLRRWRIPGFGKHVVFYRQTTDGIEVVRVLHGARNIWAILEEMAENTNGNDGG